VAPAAGMTVARPIPLRASRRVAVGLGQRFSEGSASSARPFSGILGKYFRTKNSSRSHAGATRGGFLDPGRRRAPAVEVGFFRRIKGRAQRHGPNRRWRFRYKRGNGDGPSRPGDAKNACPVLGRAGQDGR
jgi:hypothetical protein